MGATAGRGSSQSAGSSRQRQQRWGDGREAEAWAASGAAGRRWLTGRTISHPGLNTQGASTNRTWDSRCRQRRAGAASAVRPKPFHLLSTPPAHPPACPPGPPTHHPPRHYPAPQPSPCPCLHTHLWVVEEEDVHKEAHKPPVGISRGESAKVENAQHSLHLLLPSLPSLPLLHALLAAAPCR